MTYASRMKRALESLDAFFAAPRSILLTAAIGAALLSSCGNNGSSNQPHATLLLRDGTRLSGTVTSNSASGVTLAGDDNATHTVALNQVKSIEYGDTAAPQNEPTPSPKQAAEVHENHYHPSRAEIHTKSYELPAGTDVSVRTEDTIDSGEAAEGQTFAAEIADDVRDGAGDVAIPHGANAQIVIRSASKGGRFRGASDLVLDLNSVTVEGKEYLLSTADLRKSGKSGIGANTRTAEYTGGGAALGAIIGAIAGGGKGAAIGAGAGAGGGALTQILTKGSAIRVPAETVLTFKLDKPVQIVAAK